MEKDKIILLSTAYMPPIEYFAALVHAKSVYIETHETYLKQSYRNRVEIYSANGKMDLSIPIHKINGNHTLTKDIEISYTDNWNKKHWKAIESAYNKSPYFLYYRDELEHFFINKYETLLNLNTELLQFLLKKLRISALIGFTEEFFAESPDNYIDLRWKIHPKQVSGIQFEPYWQVFDAKHGFISNLSIIDLLFNLGPDSRDYLNQVNSYFLAK